MWRSFPRSMASNSTKLSSRHYAWIACWRYRAACNGRYSQTCRLRRNVPASSVLWRLSGAGIFSPAAVLMMSHEISPELVSLYGIPAPPGRHSRKGGRVFPFSRIAVPGMKPVWTRRHTGHARERPPDCIRPRIYPFGMVMRSFQNIDFLRKSGAAFGPFWGLTWSGPALRLYWKHSGA